MTTNTITLSGNDFSPLFTLFTPLDGASRRQAFARKLRSDINPEATVGHRPYSTSKIAKINEDIEYDAELYHYIYSENESRAITLLNLIRRINTNDISVSNVALSPNLSNAGITIGLNCSVFKVADIMLNHKDSEDESKYAALENAVGTLLSLASPLLNKERKERLYYIIKKALLTYSPTDVKNMINEVLLLSDEYASKVSDEDLIADAFDVPTTVRATMAIFDVIIFEYSGDIVNIAKRKFGNNEIDITADLAKKYAEIYDEIVKHYTKGQKGFIESIGKQYLYFRRGNLD